MNDNSQTLKKEEMPFLLKFFIAFTIIAIIGNIAYEPLYRPSGENSSIKIGNRATLPIFQSFDYIDETSFNEIFEKLNPHYEKKIIDLSQNKERYGLYLKHPDVTSYKEQPNGEYILTVKSYFSNTSGVIVNIRIPHKAIEKIYYPNLGVAYKNVSIKTLEELQPYARPFANLKYDMAVSVVMQTIEYSKGKYIVTADLGLEDDDFSRIRISKQSPFYSAVVGAAIILLFIGVLHFIKTNKIARKAAREKAIRRTMEIDKHAFSRLLNADCLKKLRVIDDIYLNNQNNINITQLYDNMIKILAETASNTISGTYSREFICEFNDLFDEYYNTFIFFEDRARKIVTREKTRLNKQYDNACLPKMQTIKNELKNLQNIDKDNPVQ